MIDLLILLIWLGALIINVAFKFWIMWTVVAISLKRIADWIEK